MRSLVLQLHPSDNVLVALRDLPAGQVVETPGGTLTLLEPCPAKHKLTMVELPAGAPVIQYGVTVGRTTRALARGSRIWTDNTIHATDAADPARAGDFLWTAPDVSRFAGRSFQGYRRPDGRVGTRNCWLVIPLVFCENINLLTLREVFFRELGYGRTGPYESYLRALVGAHRAGAPLDGVLFEPERTSQPGRVFPNVDGVRFLVHHMGCGGVASDAASLSALLASYIVHPNSAGATVVALGCEKAERHLVEAALDRLSPGHGRPVHFFEQQRSGTEQTLMKDAIRVTFDGMAAANAARREPSPLSALTIGVKCGGSDGFSGISANPVVGHVSDLVVALGGASVLAEFPELAGAEPDLVRRAVAPELGRKFLELMAAYERAANACGASMDNNPSPGNIRDGLITDAIKSVGAGKKGGTSPVVDVQDYPGFIRKPGLTLLNSPGHDLEATTAMAGAGANLILFTTGLGTPTGNVIVPTIKISTNTRIARHMHDAIDFDTGGVIDGDDTIESLGERLLDCCIDVASGRLVKAEELNQDDFMPWKRGVSL
jgi:altronate hydrolase